MSLFLAIVLLLSLTSTPVAGITVTMNPGDSWAPKLAQLTPGDTLQLTNGTYAPITFTCGAGTIRQGTPGAPITITAANERQARLYSDGTVPVLLMLGCQYWNIVGLTLQSGDAASAVYLGGTLLAFRKAGSVESHHVQVRRNLLYHPTTYGSADALQGFGILLNGGQHDFVFEENELYDTPGQLAFEFSTSDGNQYAHTIRRNYINNRYTSGPLSEHPEVACYFCRGDLNTPTIMENNIGENAGFGGYGGENLRLYGNISNNVRGNSLSPYLPYNVKSAAHYDRDYSRIAMGLIARDNLAIKTLYGAQADSIVSVTITHQTSMQHILHNGDPSTDSWVANGSDTRQGPDYCYYNAPDGSQPAAHCPWRYDMTVVFKDSMIINGAGSGIAFFDTGLYTGTPGGLTFSNMNVWNNAQGNYTTGAGSVGGTRYSQDPNMGTCTAWIPDGTFNKGKASDGGDIGATILYAYEGGVLLDGTGGTTAKPLWRPDGSWIGCGAIVAGINDNPAVSCSGASARLNINQNGCPFPAGYLGGTPVVQRGHYPLEEGSGTTVHDTSGNGNDLTIGSPVWVAGKIGSYALHFSGAPGGATRPVFTSPRFTWAMWVKGDTAPGATGLTQPMGNGTAADDNFGFQWDHTNPTVQQACYVGGRTGSYAVAQIPSPLLAGNWYHLASTFDGSLLTCYLNGQPVASIGGVPGAYVPTGQFHLGAAETFGFSGAVDEVVIEDRALSPDEIQALAQTGAPKVTRHRAVIAVQ